jgi:hypothetical protein
MPLNDSAQSTDRYAEELLLSRTMLRSEMLRATKAITPTDKRKLLETWKKVYKPEIVEELLRVAKDKDARHRIANWNLEQFNSERRKSK